jgi:hypothetical protein
MAPENTNSAADWARGARNDHARQICSENTSTPLVLQVDHLRRRHQVPPELALILAGLVFPKVRR